MAITAIHAQLTRVETMIKRDRLHRLIADPQISGGRIIGDPSGGDYAEDAEENQDLQRQSVG
jgi:hypothetical protein